MEFNNLYEVDISFNGTSLELDPSSYSFVLRDNIHSLYPSATLYLKDIGGILSEQGVFMQGNKFNIKFGYQDFFLENNYCIHNEGVSSILGQGNMGGVHQIDLIHDYYEYQYNICKAYSTSIDSIVTKKANEYGKFRSTLISNTKDRNLTWYQPNIHDADFITNILQKNAYSSNSEESPYFAFIDSNNTLNFSYYHKFMQKESVSNMLLAGPSAKNTGEDTINEVRPVLAERNTIRPLENRQVFYWTQEGEFKTKEDSFLDYPKDNKIIPIRKYDNNPKSYICLHEEEKTSNITNTRNKAERVNTMIPGLSSEKFIGQTMFNPDLRAGKKITLGIPTGEENNTAKSVRYSGDFLIEKSLHGWDGSGGSTTIVFSHQKVKGHPDYKLLKECFRNI